MKYKEKRIKIKKSKNCKKLQILDFFLEKIENLPKYIDFNKNC